MKTLLLLLSSLPVLSPAKEIQYCPAGTRLHTPIEGTKLCLPCLDGVNFTSEAKHTHQKCYDCTKINESDHEIEVSPCSVERDTEILCSPGYYRHKARNSGETDKCEPCRLCTHPARACEGYHDTVCCQPGYDAVITGEGRYICKKRPTVCGPGQYFVNASEGECLTCPDGTFMCAHNHTYTKCANCKYLSGDPTTHAVIGRPCSITSPTLFSCEPGYFRDPLVTSLEIEVACQPCQKCLHELAPCDMYHDAKCSDFEPTEFTSVPESPKPADGPKRRPDQESFSGNQNQTVLTSGDQQAVATNCFVVPLVFLLLYRTLLHITLSYIFHLHFKSPNQTTRLARALIVTHTKPTLIRRFILWTQVMVTLIVAFIFLLATSYHVRFGASTFYMVAMATLFFLEIIFIVYTCRKFLLSPIETRTERKGKDKTHDSESRPSDGFVDDVDRWGMNYTANEVTAQARTVSRASDSRPQFH